MGGTVVKRPGLPRYGKSRPKQGGIYVLRGGITSMPPDPTITPQKPRWIILIQETQISERPDVKTGLVVPTSTSSAPGPFDFKISNGLDLGFDDNNVTILVSLIQPIALAEIDLENRKGDVSDDEMGQIHSRLFQQLGL